MKLYGESAGASMSMHDDQEIRDVLKRVIQEEKIDHVLETGTHKGLGSTRFIAEAFPEDSSLAKFVTIEANWKRWRKAKRNLSRFSFVQPLWGNSVHVNDALDFIRHDKLLHDHRSNDDIFIDDINDPIAFYSKEILAEERCSPFMFFITPIMHIDAVFNYQGEDVLRRYLREFRNKKLLVVLDSAGGIGFLEFSVLLEEMSSYPYLILLDDILHIKHYRSYNHIRSDSSFSIIALNEQSGWLFAKHIPKTVSTEQGVRDGRA